MTLLLLFRTSISRRTHGNADIGIKRNKSHRLIISSTLSPPMELSDSKLAFCSLKFKPKYQSKQQTFGRNIHTTIVREYQVTSSPRRFPIDFQNSRYHLKSQKNGLSTTRRYSSVPREFHTHECRIRNKVPQTAEFFRLYSSNFSFDDETAIGNVVENSGLYMDLEQIFETLDDSDGHDEDTNRTDSDGVARNEESSSENIEKWRSQHWIVLIDDEPAIRLAVGDYLYAMGYNIVTACDGPLAFLEMLLWTLAWSSSLKLHANEEGGDHEIRDGHKIARPPWIDTHEGDPKDITISRLLPNCIISDIRMPGVY